MPSPLPASTHTLPGCVLQCTEADQILITAKLSKQETQSTKKKVDKVIDAYLHCETKHAI